MPDAYAWTDPQAEIAHLREALRMERAAWLKADEERKMLRRRLDVVTDLAARSAAACEASLDQRAEQHQLLVAADGIIDRLRDALVQCAEAAGAKISGSCSVEFLLLVPQEVHALARRRGTSHGDYREDGLAAGEVASRALRAMGQAWPDIVGRAFGHKDGQHLGFHAEWIIRELWDAPAKPMPIEGADVRLANLEAAVRPFIEAAAGTSDFWADNRRMASLSYKELTVGHLRRLACAVADANMAPLDQTDDLLAARDMGAPEIEPIVHLGGMAPPFPAQVGMAYTAEGSANCDIPFLNLRRGDALTVTVRGGIIDAITLRRAIRL